MYLISDQWATGRHYGRLGDHLSAFVAARASTLGAGGLCIAAVTLRLRAASGTDRAAVLHDCSVKPTNQSVLKITNVVCGVGSICVCS